MIFRWGSLGIGILIVIFLGLQAGSWLNINDLSESVQVWGVEDICDDIEDDDDDDDLVLSKEGFVSSRVNVVRPTTAMAVNIAHSQGNSLSQKVLFSNSSFLSYR